MLIIRSYRNARIESLHVKEISITRFGKVYRWNVHFHCGMPMTSMYRGERDWKVCVNPFCKYMHLVAGGCDHGGHHYAHN